MADNAVHAVTSNQETIYKHLDETVRKYIATRFLRPIADHTREAFENTKSFISKLYDSTNHGNFPSKTEGFTVILDSGCGTGESTLHIARRFPGIPVIGIDKSAVRLNKAGNEHQLTQLPKDVENIIPNNAFWVRAELLDFWRLALEEVRTGRWKIPYHSVFYPNPWPKESEAGRRFHLHPIFPTMLGLGLQTELRTNWEIYAREFAEAARIVCDSVEGASIVCESFDPEIPETAFERKYKEARQQLWRVIINK